MSVNVDVKRLRAEMTRRCWNAADLARPARLTHATVSAARRPGLASRSLACIAHALKKAPVVSLIEALLATVPSGGFNQAGDASASAILPFGAISWRHS